MSDFLKKMGERFVATEALDSEPELPSPKTTKQELVKTSVQKSKDKSSVPNTKTNILPIEWWNWFWASFFISAIGGFLVSYSATRMNIGMVRIGFYDRGLNAIYWIGIIILTISLIVWIVAIKEMIAEAFVRGLEVYHGKKRAIESDDTAPTGWSWGE